MNFFKGGEPFFISPKNTPNPIDYQLLQAWDLQPGDQEQQVIAHFQGAAYFKQLDTVKTGVLANIPLQGVGRLGFTVLTGAARGGALEVVKYLLELDLNPAYAPKAMMAYNTYHAACAGGHRDIVDYLLQHHADKIKLEMTEPLYLQTGLQIAIINNQFTFATQLIDEYLANPYHADIRGRTALAAALGVFVRSAFEEIAHNTEQLQNLSDLCLKLLASENAFSKLHARAKPAIFVILYPTLALNLPAGLQPSRKLSPEQILETIMLSCRKVAKELLRQANLNPHGEFENQFICNYKDRVLLDMEPAYR